MTNAPSSAPSSPDAASGAGAMPASRVVTVALGERSYPIAIGPGLLAQAGALTARHAPAKKIGIVTDTNVAALHAAALKESLGAAGFQTTTIALTPGEATKRFDQLEHVLNALLDARIERNDIVMALGGGVIGDLAGCAAGLLRRGVRCVQVPTSLLAQVDSSVGGKTGINSRHGKNLIGVFHQPSLVIIDTDVLDTLPERQLRAGYAEVVKYGLLGDFEFYSWLERHWQEIWNGGPGRTEAIARSCTAKAAIVAADEREAGVRALLNLGHTFGHALEAATGYSDRLLHGEGVAIGMAVALRFSQSLGHIAGQEVDRAVAHLKAVGLPTEISAIPGPALDADGLMHHIRQDKKVADGALTFILARALGDAFVARDVAPDAVLSCLKRELQRS